jgi:hypothetical protein
VLVHSPANIAARGLTWKRPARVTRSGRNQGPKKGSFFPDLFFVSICIIMRHFKKNQLSKMAKLLKMSKTTTSKQAHKSCAHTRARWFDGSLIAVPKPCQHR